MQKGREGNFRVAKVKGHADEEMVLFGQVLEDDRSVNDLADEAADLGRGRVDPGVMVSCGFLSCSAFLFLLRVLW